MDLPELIKRFRSVYEDAARSKWGVEPDSIIAAMGQAADALERLQRERDELAAELAGVDRRARKHKVVSPHHYSEAEVWD